MHQVRLEGGVQPRRTDPLARSHPHHARPAQRSRCAGLPSDRLELGSLRRVFCRADRGAAMTTLTLRTVKGDFVVTGPDIEPMRFDPSRGEGLVLGAPSGLAY